MGLSAITNGFEKAVSPIKSVFEVISGTVLALMMFLTAVDVALRYIFNSPISGALEVVEYMMAVMVPFALTVTAFNKAHIGVDMIMERFSRKIRARMGCFTHLLAFVLYAAITWQCFLNIGEQYDSGMTSAVLLIPHYPFVVSLTAAFALLSLITLMHFFEKLTEVIS
jgi:TRAP-type C4-dicarboxylate transport system permease small subunit